MDIKGYLYMQIAILPMPPFPGLPANSEIGISKDMLLRSYGSIPKMYWSDINNPTEVILGSNISISPKSLFKAIYASKDYRYVFETVFSVEYDRIVCIYTKLISSYTDIGISLNAVKYYSNDRSDKIPLTDVIIENYWHIQNGRDQSIVHSIVPLITSIKSLDCETMEIVDVVSDMYNKYKLAWRYKPLYNNLPHITEAMILGKFIRSPFLELRHPCPYVDIRRFDNHFVLEYDRNCDTYTNHCLFNELAVRLTSIVITDLSITISIQAGIEGILDLAVTKYLHNAYGDILPKNTTNKEDVYSCIKSVIYTAITHYCTIYDIDLSTFQNNHANTSYLILEKNIYDEVIIRFNDTANGRMALFYSYLPVSALNTLGVARYIENH